MHEQKSRQLKAYLLLHFEMTKMLAAFNDSIRLYMAFPILPNIEISAEWNKQFACGFCIGVCVCMFVCVYDDESIDVDSIW